MLQVVVLHTGNLFFKLFIFVFFNEVLFLYSMNIVESTNESCWIFIDKLGVGSRGSILGHVLKSIWSVFFSLSYIPNKTKQPKFWRFGPIKKFAPLKTEAKSTWPKIRIFEACSNLLPHNSPLSTFVGNLWIHMERRGIRELIKTN